MSQIRAIAFAGLLITAMLAGCAHTAQVQPPPEDIPVVKSIVVLPAEISPPVQGVRPAEEIAQLATGQRLFDTMLAEYFTNRANVNLLSATQVQAMDKGMSRTRSAAAINICLAVKADAVLLLTLHRFHEREGSQYSIVSPASVDFDYKLLHGATGQVLCSGAFNETQQPLLDNILQFFKKAKRGVKWLSAEELARDGFQQKISDCPLLKQ